MVDQQKIVLTSGAFDILHSGHMALLSAGKSLSRKIGGRFVVLLNSAESIHKYKSISRPIKTDEERLKSLLSVLEKSGEVVLWDEPSVVNALLKFRPDFFLKGIDRVASLDSEEKDICNKIGTTVLFAGDPQSLSTTVAVINSRFRIGVCVPFKKSHNDANLPFLRERILGLSRFHHVFDQIVISHTTDSLLEHPIPDSFFDSFEKTIPILYCFKTILFPDSLKPARTISHGVNLGISLMEKSINTILLVDTGAVLGRKYIENLKNLHTSFDLIVPFILDSLFPHGLIRDIAEDYLSIPTLPYRVGCGWTGISFKREHWEIINGWNEEMIGHQYMDTDFIYRISSFPVEKRFGIDYLGKEHGLTDQERIQYLNSGTLNRPFLACGIDYPCVVIKYPGKSDYPGPENERVLDPNPMNSSNRPLFIRNISQLKRNPIGITKSTSYVRAFF